MTLIAWNDTGPILKDGAIGTEQECCCGSGCNVNQTFSWGSEVSGAISYSIDFPSAEHCVKVVITITSFPPEIIITSRTAGVPGSTILYGWSSEGSVTLCLKKADGRDRIQIDFQNNAGTSGSIEVTCDTCDCNEFP
jgi:hypothetical protein